MKLISKSRENFVIRPESHAKKVLFQTVKKHAERPVIPTFVRINCQALHNKENPSSAKLALSDVEE